MELKLSFFKSIQKILVCKERIKCMKEILCKFGMHKYENNGGETGYRHLKCERCGKEKVEAR